MKNHCAGIRYAGGAPFWVLAPFLPVPDGLRIPIPSSRAFGGNPARMAGGHFGFARLEGCIQPGKKWRDSLPGSGFRLLGESRSGHFFLGPVGSPIRRQPVQGLARLRPEPPGRDQIAGFQVAPGRAPCFGPGGIRRGTARDEIHGHRPPVSESSPRRPGRFGHRGFREPRPWTRPARGVRLEVRRDGPNVRPVRDIPLSLSLSHGGRRI